MQELVLTQLVFEFQYLPLVYVFKESYNSRRGFTQAEQDRTDKGPGPWGFSASYLSPGLQAQQWETLPATCFKWFIRTLENGMKSNK